MERQGTCIHNHVNSRQYVGASMHVLVFFAVLFFFVVNSYAVCDLITVSGRCSGGGRSCSLQCPSQLQGYKLAGSVSGQGSGCSDPGTITFNCGGDLDAAFVVSSTYYRSCVGSDYSARADFSVKYCSDPCEAEREYCLSQGLDFDADSCKCKMPCPEDVCDAYKTQCEQVLQGSFTGRCERSGAGGEPCCNGYCDICSGPGIQGNYNEMKKICCGQYKAPPAIGNVCWQNPAFSSGCHVYQSTVRAPEGEQWACHDPNQSQEMMNRYMDECFGGSSSSTGGSSNSGGSSGGGGNSSDEGGGGSSGHNPYPEGCEECPWLDSILDTLTAQKSTIDQIYTCVKYPSLCDPNASSETIVEVDSNILNGVKDLIDSSLELSNEQIEALLKLDTNTLKMLKLDSVSLSNDTLTRLAILSVGGDIQNSLSDVQLSVVHMNDSTRKWLRRLADSLSAQNDSNRKYFEMVADSIGVTADSLKAHLDSIRDAIPKDILDSILKYQKELADDSIVISSFPGLDSMIDTVVYYWTKIMHNDSLFHKDNKDSLKVIHDAIDGIGLNVGFVLGYGDTATTDLHGDLLNLRDSIVNALNNLPGADTSRYVENNDSIRAIHEAIDTMRSDVNVFRDSVIKYYRASYSADSVYRVTFGDSVGSLHGAIDGVKGSVDGVKGSVDGVKDAVDGVIVALNSIDGKLTASGEVDTSYVPGWVGRGERLGDTIANETGLNGVDYGNDTTAYLAAERNANFECVGDSCCVGPDCVYMESDQSINDSLSRRVQRLADSARVMNEQYKNDSVTSYLAQVKDSVSSWNPLGVFDSTLLHTLGAKIPNTNTCPEHCSKFEVNIPFFFGVLPVTIDYGLCLGRSVFGGGNLMSFFRFLIRLVLSITCVTMVMWNAARFKR